MPRKTIVAIMVFLLMSFSLSASANSNESTYDPLFALADVVLLRPIGLAATIAGAAVFIGISPLTALASIAPPHDAFSKTGYALVMTPVDFTFKRPVGVHQRVEFSAPPNVPDES